MYFILILIHKPFDVALARNNVGARSATFIKLLGWVGCLIIIIQFLIIVTYIISSVWWTAALHKLKADSTSGNQVISRQNYMKEVYCIKLSINDTWFS